MTNPHSARGIVQTGCGHEGSQRSAVSYYEQNPPLGIEIGHLERRSQRSADEMNACRRFRDAKEWIDHIDRLKGEPSGLRHRVWIHGPRGPQQALYTQSREYHMTGSIDDMIPLPNGNFGCERVEHLRPMPAVYQNDVQRANQLTDAVFRARLAMQQQASSSSFRLGEQHVRSIPPGFPDNTHIRLPGGNGAVNGIAQDATQTPRPWSVTNSYQEAHRNGLRG